MANDGKGIMFATGEIVRYRARWEMHDTLATIVRVSLPGGKIARVFGNNVPTYSISLHSGDSRPMTVRPETLRKGI